MTSHPPTCVSDPVSESLQCLDYLTLMGAQCEAAESFEPSEAFIDAHASKLTLVKLMLAYVLRSGY
jgi:hypothetical protein